MRWRIRGPFYARLAAGSGVGFVAALAAIVIIGEVKDFRTAADFALASSNEVFGTTGMLLGLAVALFLWFSGTLSARLRQLELTSGDSPRLSSVVLASGALIAGLLAVAGAAQFGARHAVSGEVALALTGLADGIFYGPLLAFPIAVYIGATGVVGVRAEGLPLYSAALARLSLLASLAFLGGGSLWLFRRLAWIDETTIIVFLVWVLALSIVGILRWGDMDEGAFAAPAAPARRRAEVQEVEEVPTEAMPRQTPAPRRRKPARRKPGARKPSARRSTRRSE